MVAMRVGAVNTFRTGRATSDQPRHKPSHAPRDGADCIFANNVSLSEVNKGFGDSTTVFCKQKLQCLLY